jgi:predicted N-acetyltransferase YhbS
MELRFAKKNDVDGITRLWDECFPGDEAFREYYMAEIFEPANTLVHEDGGRVVSMAHMLPMEMDYHTRIVPVCYVYAMGTDPAYRGKGLAAELMEQVFRELRQRDIPLAVIVPQEDSLFDYYGRFGFAGVFSIGRERIARRDFPDLPGNGAFELVRSNLFGYGTGSGIGIGPGESGFPSGDILAAANTVFEKVMIYRNHIRRTAEHWERVVRTAEISGGGMFVLKKDGLFAGYAVCEMSGSGPVINELICEDEDSFNALGAGVLDAFGVPEAELFTAACPHDARRFAMARVVDAGKMLSLAASYRKDMECSFKLSDRHAPWNTARYTISGEKVERSGSAGSKAYITPSQLADILFGAGPMPYANLLFY